MQDSHQYGIRLIVPVANWENLSIRYPFIASFQRLGVLEAQMMQGKGEVKMESLFVQSNPSQKTVRSPF